MSAIGQATKRWMRFVTVPAAVLTLLLLTASRAHAQQQINNGGRPPVQWIQLSKGDSATGSAQQKGDRISELALEPLRLSLLGEYVPHPSSGGASGGCSEHPEATGSLTGTPAFPMQRISALRIFGPSSPFGARLSLFGFSRGGCAIDSAGGGGFSFTLPIRRDTFFVLSGGAIYLPQGGQNGKSVSSSQARVDLVFARDGNRSWTVGVGMVRGSPRISVGGVW